MRALLAVLVFLLAASPAGASAVYHWQSADKTSCCEATLEITNEAYAAGAVALRIQQGGSPLPMSDSPVIRFEWSGYGDRILFDRTSVRGMFDFNVSLVGESVSGEIRANDLSTDTLLAGTGDSWTVKNHHADHPGDCFRADNACAGAGGRWVLVSSPED